MNVEWKGSDIIVLIEGQVGVEMVDAVLDINESGEVIGVEMLGLLAKHPGLLEQAQDLEAGSGAGHCALDVEADALYIRLNDGRSVDQRCLMVAAAFGPTGRLIALGLRPEG